MIVGLLDAFSLIQLETVVTSQTLTSLVIGVAGIIDFQTFSILVKDPSCGTLCTLAIDPSPAAWILVWGVDIVDSASAGYYDVPLIATDTNILSSVKGLTVGFWKLAYAHVIEVIPWRALNTESTAVGFAADAIADYWIVGRSVVDDDDATGLGEGGGYQKWDNEDVTKWELLYGDSSLEWLHDWN